jgi:glycosyltransferase involved in cell wall biosynthesis
VNILYVSNLYPPNIAGGAELICSYLAESISNDSQNVSVISTKGPTYPTNDKFINETINGVEVIRFFPKNIYWFYKKQKQSSFNKLIWHLIDSCNLDSARTFSYLLKEKSPDIIHTHNLDGISPIIWSEAKKLNIPVVHTVHDYHLLCPHSTLLHRNLSICSEPNFFCKLYRKWYKMMAPNIDVLVSPSQFLLDLFKDAKFQAKDFRVIPNGITLKTNDVLKNNNLRQNKISLLYMGQLEKHKGIEILIQAFSSIPNDNITLNIAGKGRLEKNIIDISEKDSRIKFHGFVSGDLKEELFKSNDFLVLPSIWYENAPVSIIEAYDNGLGIIGSNIGGIPEMITDGETGYIFQPGDITQLRSVLLKIIETPDLIERMGLSIKAKSQTYSIKNMTQRYNDLYKGLIKK